MNKRNIILCAGGVCLLTAGAALAEARLEQQSLLKSVGQIQDYYQRVQEKLGGPAQDTPVTKPDQELPVDQSAPATARPMMLPVGIPDAPQPPQHESLADSARELISGFVPSPEKAGYRENKRNPFAPTRQILQASAPLAGGNVPFQPLQQATQIPRMFLRGLVNEKNGELAALLEIEHAGTHIVREGDTVGLYESGSNSVIRIRKINRLNLVVEAGSLGQLIIVR